MANTYSIHSEFGGYEFLQVRKSSLWENVLSYANTEPSARVFLNDGWQALHTKHSVSGATEFVKDRVALFMNPTAQAEKYLTWRDKCHALYVRDEIDVGIEILPMKSMQAQMSSGVDCYEGKLYNVVRNGRGVPAVPLVILGIDA